MLIVFGSINLDLVFRVGTLPAPGATVLAEAYQEFPGGKGANQAAAAAKAGAPVVFAGAVGRDAAGEALLQGLAALGVDVAAVRRVDAPTGRAAIAVDADGENLIMVASGANLEVDAASLADGGLSTRGVLLLQNEVPDAANLEAARLARGQGVRVVLNAAPWRALPADLLGALDLLIVNAGEWQGAAAQLGVAGAPSVAAGLAALVANDGPGCLVTESADGVLFADDGGTVWRCPTLAVDVADTTGAGDTFAGVLAGRLALGDDVFEAVRHATVAAAISCTSLGAQEAQPHADDIARYLPMLATMQQVELG